MSSKMWKLLCPLFVLSISACTVSGDWRTASRESAGLAPDPDEHEQAIIQVYGADAWGWRGWFAIHTWISTKRAGELEYKVHDVVGWRKRYGGSVVRAMPDVPDRYWYGAKPELIAEVRGDRAEALIDEIEQAVADYPWKDEYQAFPGPNSNTFVAWVGKQVPGLGLELPFSAIGSGYVGRFRGEMDGS